MLDNEDLLVPTRKKAGMFAFQDARDRSERWPDESEFVHSKDRARRRGRAMGSAGFEPAVFAV